jgi:hypothetical protein
LVVQIPFALGLEEEADVKAEVFGERLASILEFGLLLVDGFNGLALGRHVGLGKASGAGNAIDVLGRLG